MKTKNQSAINLNGIIQKIKTEGIEEAERKSAGIIDKAQKKASNIINSARQEAEAIIKEAKKDIRNQENVTQEYLKQAARDIILNIRESLISTFDALIKKECQEIFSQKTMETILLKLIEAWQKDNGEAPILSR